MRLLAVLPELSFSLNIKFITGFTFEKTNFETECSHKYVVVRNIKTFITSLVGFGTWIN